MSRLRFAIFLIFGPLQILRAQILDLQAHTLRYDENTQVVVATGNVSLTSGGIRLWAKEAKGNLSKNLFHMKGVSFTTCDASTPHYRFRALKARLHHQKNISVALPILQWGPVPVFFFPYYFRLLGERALRVDNEFGSNNTSGIFVKNIIGYPTSSGTYTKIYADYFSRKGWGKGVEFTYRKEESVKGSFYGYDIYDKGLRRHRWNTRYFHWQRFGRGLDLHASSDISSDDSFSQLFNAEDYIPIVRELRNEAGLSLRRSLWSAHLTGKRRDLWVGDKFLAEEYVLPAFSFSSIPIRIGNSLFFAAGRGSVARTFLRSENFDKIEAEAGLDLSYVLRFSRRFSLLPTVGWTQGFVDRKGLSDFSDDLKSIYRTEVVGRAHMNPVWYFDLTHRFQQRVNLPDDPFHGVLSHKVDVFTAARGNRIGVKAGTGMDLRQAIGSSFGPFFRRMDGLFLEADWDPSYHLNLYLREDFNLFEKRFNSVSTEFKLKSWGGSYLKSGLSYIPDRPWKISLRHGIGLTAKKWNLDFSTQYNIINDQPRFVYKEASLIRDLHCWEMRLIWRDRAGASEVWAMLSIKPPASPKKSTFPETLTDEEWYPWRKKR